LIKDITIIRYFGKLLFSGTYKFGKKWNGYIYNSKGNLEFGLNDGDGSGKEYDFFNNITYEGNYKYGNRSGIGKEYNDGKMVYEGEFSGGDRHGKGREYNKLGQLIFEGEYKFGERYKGKIMEYYKEQLLFKADYSRERESDNLEVIKIIDSEECFNGNSKYYRCKK